MTNRERFRRLMANQPVDRLPVLIGGIWGDTMRRWEAEGYPRGVPPDQFFEVEPFRTAYVGPATGPWPLFPQEVVRETATEVIRRDSYGRLTRDFKDRTTMPEWLEFPVQSPSDLERVIAERFDLSRMAERWPADWAEKVRHWNSPERGGTILFLDGGCYYWTLRSLAGVEYASYLFCDAPDLVDELCERICQVCLAGIARAMPQVEVDYLGFGEDIAYKTSTLISPAMFKRHILPRDRATVAVARAHGLTTTWYDSDGNLWPFLPLYLEIGITGFAPLEVAAGMDPVALRREFGPTLRLLGGVDKREIAKGPAAIDALLDHLAPVIAEGGYLPYIDHSVPADISLANYQYYLQRLKPLLGWD